MPNDFNQCVKNGGQVITHKINKDQYIHICYIGGKSYAGEVKVKQNKSTQDVKPNG